MTKELSQRVDRIDERLSINEGDIKVIKTKVGHIEKGVSDIEETLKITAQTGIDAVLLHKDTNTEIKAMKAFAKGSAWLFGALLTLIGSLIGILVFVKDYAS